MKVIMQINWRNPPPSVCVFWLIFLSLNQMTIFAQSKEPKRTQEILAKLIITEFLDDSADKDHIFLLRKNFPLSGAINGVNKNRKTKIKLVNRSISGEEVYFFKSLSVKKNFATIMFGNTWRSLSRLGFYENIYQYKCKKNKGKWRCRLGSLTSTQS